MGTIVTKGLGTVLSVIGLSVCLPAQGGGGWSKAVASYPYSAPVNRLSDGVRSMSFAPVFVREPSNIPSTSPLVHDKGKGSSEITVLPNELLVKILVNLTIQDLLVCKHVCKNWQKLVTTVPALACVAYHSCHPAGYVPGLNDTIKNYHGSIRQWLNSFSEQGSQAVTRLDGILASGGPHFPEQLFFTTARVLDEAPAFDCRKVHTIEYSEPVLTAGFSPDEQHLLSYSRHTVRVCSFVDGHWQDMDTFQQTGPIICAYFSPDSKYMVVRLTNYRTKIWALADGQWQQQVGGYLDAIRLSPRFNADTTYLVTASIDHAQLYRVIDGQWQPQVTALNQHLAQNAYFHPREPDLLATYWHNTVTLWRFVDGQWQQDSTLPHPHRIAGICFSPDGNRLMTYSGGSPQHIGLAEVSIHVWHREGREWRKQATLLPRNAGYTARFSPRGNYILTTTGRYQGGIEIWRLSGGQWQDIKTSLHESVCRGDFSPDERYFATQNWMPNAIIWRCTDELLGREVVIPYSTPSLKISFSPHGNHLVVAINTTTAVICGFFAGRWQEKAILHHPRELDTIRFSPCGGYVLTTTVDGTATVWSLNAKDSSHKP